MQQRVSENKFEFGPENIALSLVLFLARPSIRVVPSTPTLVSVEQRLHIVLEGDLLQQLIPADFIT